MQYQLIILAIKDKKAEYFIKKHLAENLGFNLDELTKLLLKLPTVVLTAESSDQLTDTAALLTDLGAEVKINTPGNKVCSTHIDQGVITSCSKCTNSICVKCQQEADGLCGNCVRKQQRRKQWRFYRQLSAFGILLIVIVVAARIYYHDNKKFDWDRTYNVALIEVAYGSKESTRTLSSNGKEILQQSLEKWFESEAKRVYNSQIKPFRFEILGPAFNEKTPPTLPTENDSLWTRYKQTSAFIKFFNDRFAQTGANPDNFDIKLYLYIYPADKGLDYDKQHSVGTTRGRFGVVFLPIGKQSAGRTTCLIAHEILHTVGASDKYDGSRLTVYPDGYFFPAQRYPQQFAEIMALATPIDIGREKDADNLDTSRVGNKTAEEIGWKNPTK